VAILLGAIVAAAAIYAWRAEWHQIIIFVPLVIWFAVLLSPLLAAIAVGILIALAVPVQKAEPVHYRPHRGASPLSVPLVLVILALGLTLPVPPLRERTLFLENRSAYEDLVKLAKAGQLAHEGDCDFDRAFSAPAAYDGLTGARCIYVDPTTVAFSPYQWQITLVWSAVPDPPAASVCRLDARVLDRIDAQWFICMRG
jgi:hypothetical protein